MRSALPVRYVEDKDPEYKGLRDNVVVLKSANGEVSESDLSRIMEELRSARDAAFLMVNSRTYETHGGLSLGCLKSAIGDMISEFPPEWVRGWDSVLLLYSPESRMSKFRINVSGSDQHKCH